MNDIFFGVPLSSCEHFVDVNKMVIATREDEAVAMAVGAWFSGKNPLVFMQDSGIGNSLDIITSLLIPYNIKIDLLISQRTTPEHHKVMGEKSDLILRQVGYDSFRYC